MRRRITSNLIIVKIFGILGGISGIILSLFFLFHYTSTNGGIDFKGIMSIIMPLLIVGGWNHILYSFRRVEFDDEFMYVIRTRSEEKIPLADVFKMKMTILGYRCWTIHYYDGKRKKILIVARMPFFSYHKYFSEFQDSVRLANKDFKVLNSTLSFDPDEYND